MTDEQIRVAIALKLKFTVDPQGHWLTPEGFYCVNQTCVACHGSMGDFPPDYPNDLNAMHEAEKFLLWDGKRELTLQYMRAIYSVIDQESGEQFSELVTDSTEIAAVLLRATARQRAEAFLRTIGKWEES